MEQEKSEDGGGAERRGKGKKAEGMEMKKGGWGREWGGLVILNQS